MTVIIASDTKTGNGREYVTLAEAAARLGVSGSTLARRLKSGRLPSRRFLGRVLVPVDGLHEPETRDADAGGRS